MLSSGRSAAAVLGPKAALGATEAFQTALTASRGTAHVAALAALSARAMLAMVVTGPLAPFA